MTNFRCITKKCFLFQTQFLEIVGYDSPTNENLPHKNQTSQFWQIVNKSKLPTPRLFERRTPKTMNNSQVSVQITLFVECLCQNFTSKSSLPHHCWTCPSCCSHLLSESTFHYQYKQSLAECLNLLYNGDNIKSNFELY